jgi:hypothetical protein
MLERSEMQLSEGPRRSHAQSSVSDRASMKKRKSSKKMVGQYTEKELAKIIEDFNQKVEAEIQSIIDGALL